VQGGVVGGQLGGVVGGQLGGTVGGTGTDIIPFGAGMVRPTVVKQPEITYSKEAMAMHSGGLVLAKCTLNIDGSLSDCQIQKMPANFSDGQVQAMLRTMRFTPVTLQGRPQRVYYNVTLRIPTPG